MTLAVIWGETEFKIHDEIIELHFDHAFFSSGVIAIDAVMDPSTNPSLLLASRAILIALAQLG